MKAPAIFLLALFLGALVSQAADPPTRDPGWAEALKAYSAGRSDEGHRLLATLAEQHPGDLDLAAACYEKILAQEDRQTLNNPALKNNPWFKNAAAIRNNPWIRIAAERLLALERLGGLSANTALFRSASTTGIEVAISRLRLLEAHETVTRLRSENRHDLFWAMMEARIFGRLGLNEARPLFEKLQRDLDPDHPDPGIRADWALIAKELESYDRLPKRFLPVPEGSPLPFMEHDDPDGRWRAVLERSPKQIPAAVDRLVAHALAVGQSVPWRDSEGVIDPSRALDLHLLGQPAAELDALRQEQEQNFSSQAPAATRTEAEILALSRRFAWSRSAQMLLLKVAGDALWDGRSESALRSFQEVLLHTNDPALREAAQVGFWTAQAFSGGAEEVLAQAGAFEPGKTYPWMGRPAKGAEIRAALQVTRQAAPPVTAPSLQTVRPRVLHLPPIAPWPLDTPATGFGVDLQVAGSKVVASARNFLVAYDAANPGVPLWSQRQRDPIEENRRAGFWPGYYRPLIHDGTIFSRWGLASLPSGLAAFDLASGHPEWASLDARVSGSRRNKLPLRFAVPMGDPVRADGLLFYLQWGTVNDVQDRNGLSLSLVCFDPHTAQPRWVSTLLESIPGSDLRDADPVSAIYGNSVTVHRGAVYTSTNAGHIVRSDVRDGRVEWIHNHRRRGGSKEFLGSAPIVAGDHVICLPRNSGNIFALDQRTGRPVWANPMILANEALGICQDTLVVRGVATVAGLDLATGNARWFRSLSGRTLDRAQLLADSVYLGQATGLLRLDARTGELLESRPWDIHPERALGFTLSGQDLYIVSDRPASDPRQEVGKPLGPELAAAPRPLNLPLQRAWSLARRDATIALPPAGVSPGKAFVISDGFIECLDVSERGAIRWRRFLDANNPTLAFAGDTLVLLERSGSPYSPNRAIALDSRTGAVLWEAPLPTEHEQTFHFGSNILYHDGREKLLAFDLTTGKRVWQRMLPTANFITPQWDGTRLHLFRVPGAGHPEHLTLDPATGQTTAQNEIRVAAVSETAQTPRRQLADGFYEIRFAPAPARFVRLTSLSTAGGVSGYSSAAELHVLGPDGQRLPRDKWIADGHHEPNAGFRGKPINLLDGDPNTWWHSKWLDGITPHPHDLFLDLGTTQTVSGFQYLPAKINNNNGLIGEYELRLSQDKKDWGAPVAKGSFATNFRVQRVEFGQSAFFEAVTQPKRGPSVFRYDLGGEAVLVKEGARLVRVSGRYVLLAVRDEAVKKDTLVVHRSDDPAYVFPLQTDPGRQDQILFDGDYAITAQGRLEIADLKAKQYLNLPADEKAPIHQQGFLCRIGRDRLLKIVGQGPKQLAITIALQTGAIAEGIIENQSDPIREDRFLRPDRQQLLSFDRTLLFYDNSTLRAWVAAP